jgi:hypothetical protein
MKDKLIEYIDARIHTLENTIHGAKAEKNQDIFLAAHISTMLARRNELEQIKILIESLSNVKNLS